MNIRPATPADAPRWLELFQSIHGADFPARTLYVQEWIGSQLDPKTGFETWVVENANQLESSITLFPHRSNKSEPVLWLGRNLQRPESLTNGSAAALLRTLRQIADERGQMLATRIGVQANAQQRLYENNGYVCVGFQPLKHGTSQRTGILFYLRPNPSILASRATISECQPQVAELASAVLAQVHCPAPQGIIERASGYPLQTEFLITPATAEEFQTARTQSKTANPPIEVSGLFNIGYGPMRLPETRPANAFLCRDKENVTVGGILFDFDELDRCVRVMDSFAIDGTSPGALLARALATAQTDLGAACTEINILSTASQLLKTAEQLGFSPVAYFPAFCPRSEGRVDVVKMVKLNVSYSPEHRDLTAQARSIANVVDRLFDDDRIGLATIKLLQPLAVFAGLGEGELRKIARLFTQKLFRPGEQVFAKGERGDQAYVVLRGQIDILLEPGSKPVASLSNGKIFGELAFLDGGPRSTFAIAAQPSILLVLQRSAFLELTGREPALGMTVMRNIALDLATKLRNADLALEDRKK